MVLVLKVSLHYCIECYYLQMDGIEPQPHAAHPPAHHRPSTTSTGTNEKKPLVMMLMVGSVKFLILNAMHMGTIRVRRARTGGLSIHMVV